MANVTATEAFCKSDRSFHLFFTNINRLTFVFDRHMLTLEENSKGHAKKNRMKKSLMYLCPPGTIAQLVEQRTENPCVPGSNPGSTT
jgi:hypothetical protein